MSKPVLGVLALLIACGSTPPPTAPTVAKSTRQVTPLPCAELDFVGCKVACANGSPHACTLAAESVDEDRRGHATQKAEIIGLLEKGCTGGDPAACRNLGHAYREGQRVPQDPSKSDAFYKKAFSAFESGCANKRAESCDLLGHMTGQGWGTAKNEDEEKRLRQRAIELYEQACSASDPASCAVAGDAYQVGYWVPHDVARARKLLGTGCDANDPQSCFLIGLNAEFGTQESTKDLPAAAKLLRKACDAGSAKGCSTLGEMMASGDGVPKDGPGALTLLERACHGPGELLDAPACHDAARLRTALGEAPTSAKVMELERRACTLGFNNGCEALKTPR